MKLRTRKFLAGLLSLGLLLQAASPLSALAAEDAPVATHTLTVTVGNTTYNLTANGGTVSSDETWPLGYPAVSYDDGFAFEGGFNGDVTLNGGENVTIKGESYAVNGSLNATVNDLTVTKSDSGTDAAIRDDATITSAGDVRISGNLDYNNISLVNQAVEGKLTVNSAQDVSIDGILNGGADINCQTLSLNCGNGSTVSGTLTVHNAQKIQATAFAIYGVIGDRGKAGKLVLDHCTGAVTLCNTYGYEAVQAGTVEVRNLPTGYVARYYAGSSEAESTETQDANDCARYSYFRIEYVNPSNKTLTLTNAKAYTDAEYTTELINATSANGTSTYHVDEGKTVYVKAVAPGEGQWKFEGWTGSEETSEETNEKINVTVNEDMTLTANWAEDTSKPDVPSYGFKVNGKVANENTLPVGLVYTTGRLTASTNYTGDLTIEVTDPALKLDVSLQSVTGDVTLLDVNDVAITGTVNGMLTVGAKDAYASGNVTVNGRLLGGTEINCIGNVKATGSSNGSILRTKDLYQPDIIRCNGAVYLENTGNGYTTCSLTVIGATDVTVKANGEFHAAISGEGDITCSGTVTLTTTGVRAMGSNDPLTYTQMNGDSYTVQLDDQAPFTRTGIFKESEENLLSKVKSITITPTGSTPAPGPDDGDTTPDDTGTVDSGSGAVAAVLVGGAAVWGGYEIATRVILHNILPEGAEIPANRGQLALLVWNTAGRPEPVNTPAFADVADADTAKAAQWCVEQGIMDAKSESTFKPEGWMPKFKTIEVWERAFPKQ